MLLHPIKVQFSKSTLKPSVYSLTYDKSTEPRKLNSKFESLYVI